MKRILNYREMLANGDVTLYRMVRYVHGNQRVAVCVAITRVELADYRDEVARKLWNARAQLADGVAWAGQFWEKRDALRAGS